MQHIRGASTAVLRSKLVFDLDERDGKLVYPETVVLILLW